LSGKRQVHLLAYGEDLLSRLAQCILSDHAAALPDLHHIVVVFPHHASAARFRRVLLTQAIKQGHAALLPPHTTTLTRWVSNLCPHPGKLLSVTARTALLRQALLAHPKLCDPQDSWALADSLLKLFDELQTSNHRIADKLSEFQTTLAEAYGTESHAKEQLSHEANLIHTLWHSWTEQLCEQGLTDPVQAYVSSLNQSLDQARDSWIYLAGHVSLNDVERDWVKQLLDSGRLQVFMEGQYGHHDYHPDTVVTQLLDRLGKPNPVAAPVNAYGRLLNTVYDNSEQSWCQRIADQAAATAQSPAADKLTLHLAVDAEREAQTIDLLVRRWWLQGKRHIGVVTGDRKLARRVRALLERAGIQVQDAAGWRLATTSAASALISWFDTVEQDFSQAPLLDLMKSPFVASPQNDNDNGCDPDAIHGLFEHECVLKAQITGPLEHYQNHIRQNRLRLLETYGVDGVTALEALLVQFELAAKALLKLRDGQHHPGAHFLSALHHSLDQLGLGQRYRQDAAGQQLIHLLSEMGQAAAEHNLNYTWDEFRAWLNRQLEQHNFQPPLRGQGIELMGLIESRLYSFEALIIAGASSEHLPGKSPSSAFFNDGVRTQWGLPGTTQSRNTLFYDFRRLLQSAPQVVVTSHREEQGEPVIKSPWLERLQHFHQQAYNHDLDDPELTISAGSADTRIRYTDQLPLPTPHTVPRPVPDVRLIPNHVSAANQQRLLNCPYQYFVYDCMGIAQTPTLSEDLEKSDYGERVHRILHALYADVAGLAGPWQGPINEGNRQQAEAMLNDISKQAFLADTRNNILARGWLYRWLGLIDKFVDWEVAHQKDWQPDTTELSFDQPLGADPTIQARGRIDRVDKGRNGFAIIDYKTGATSSVTDIEQGEQIQLPFYALLHSGPVDKIFFLSLSEDRVRETGNLEGDSLKKVVTLLQRRITTTAAELKSGAALPAWGDEKTCGLCQLEGLCRKQMWQANDNAST